MGLGNRILKVKATYKCPFRKYDIYELNFRENDLSPLRAHWRALFMGRTIEVGGKKLIVHAIEAFAIHDSQPHESIGLVVSLAH